MQVVASQKCVVQNRFYHFFKRGELSELGRAAGLEVNAQEGRRLYAEIYGDAQEAEEYFDHDNWYCVFQKK